METEKTLYDSRAMREGDYREADWAGWERLEPRQGVVYVRRRVEGPAAPQGEWRETASCPTR